MTIRIPLFVLIAALLFTPLFADPALVDVPIQGDSYAREFVQFNSGFPVVLPNQFKTKVIHGMNVDDFLPGCFNVKVHSISPSDRPDWPISTP